MSENTKYKLTDDSMIHDGEEVFRIEALQDMLVGPDKNFTPIKAGDLGGYVASEDNLASDINDTSWIYDDGVVKGDSRVERDSVVYHNAVVQGKSLIANQSGAFGDVVIEDSILDNKSEAIIDHNGEEAYPTVVNSKLKNNVDSKGSTIKDSNISNSKLEYANLDHAKVNNSRIDSQTNVYYSSVLNSTIQGDNDIRHSKVSDIADMPDGGHKIHNSTLTNYDQLGDGRTLKNNKNEAELAGAVELNASDLEDLNNLEVEQGLNK